MPAASATPADPLNPLAGPLTNEDGVSLPVSDDMRAWVRNLAEPCEMPYALIIATGWFPDSRHRDETAVQLLIQPEDRTLANLVVHFDRLGRWQEVLMSNGPRITPIPSPADGYSAAEAAHQLAVMLEHETGPWGSRRSMSLSRADAAQEIRRRLARIARVRIGDEVRRAALEALAAEHPEEFQTHLGAHQVAQALASDWYLEPDVAS